MNIIIILNGNNDNNNDDNNHNHNNDNSNPPRNLAKALNFGVTALLLKAGMPRALHADS